MKDSVIRVCSAVSPMNLNVVLQREREREREIERDVVRNSD